MSFQNDSTQHHDAHTIEYRVKSTTYATDPPRRFDVQASPEQIGQLVKDGYMVRERVLSPELLAELRQAADAMAEQSENKGGEGGSFDGLFIRGLIDKNPTFLRHMLKFEPTLSVARAVLGPQVQIHATVLRVSYPEMGAQRVQWHFHQRAVPEPTPAFYWRPVVLDNLIYLDDLTMETGPLVVLPGSHLHDEVLPDGDHNDKPGQVVVQVPAGSIVTSHSSLWHKAMPTLPGGTKRRLLILGYSAVWQKPVDPTAAYLGKPGLTTELVQSGGLDIETRELLGLWGYH